MMDTMYTTINLILKAIAVAMSVAVVTLGYLGQVEPGALVTLLGIGLFALSILSFRQDTRSKER